MLSKRFNSNRWITYVCLIGVFATTFLFIVSFLTSADFVIFHSRDLYRATEILKGNLILYGPEMTNGGYLSGPTAYLLHAVPLFLFGSWKSVLIWTIFLSSFATSVLWNEIKKWKGPYTACLCILIYLGGLLGPMATLTNLHPAYLFFFSPLILCCYLNIFFNQMKNNEKYFYAAFFLIGLAVQVHFSAAVWIVLFAISFFFYKRLEISRPKGRIFLYKGPRRISRECS